MPDSKRLLAMARSALARLMHNVPNSGSILSQAPLPALSTRHGAVGVEWLGRVAGVVSAAAARGPKNEAALSQNKCCDEAANTAREGGRVSNEGLQAIAARSRLSSAPHSGIKQKCTRKCTRKPPTAQQLTLVYVAVLARGTVECGGAEVAWPNAAANQLCRLEP